MCDTKTHKRLSYCTAINEGLLAWPTQPSTPWALKGASVLGDRTYVRWEACHAHNLRNGYKTKTVPWLTLGAQQAFYIFARKELLFSAHITFLAKKITFTLKEKRGMSTTTEEDNYSREVGNLQ